MRVKLRSILLLLTFAIFNNHANLNILLFNPVSYVRNYLALYLCLGRRSSRSLNQCHLLATVLVSLYPWCSFVSRHDKLFIFVNYFSVPCRGLHFNNNFDFEICLFHFREIKFQRK